MKDAFGQEVNLGDFVILTKSKNFKLAIVTELLPDNKIDTVRPEFDGTPVWNQVARRNDVRNVSIGLKRLKLMAQGFVRADPNAHLGMNLQRHRYWWPTPDLDNPTPEDFRRLNIQRELFEYLRQNHLNKKVKIPEHLKNV